jgi:hypothetical protein
MVADRLTGTLESIEAMNAQVKLECSPSRARWDESRLLRLFIMQHSLMEEGADRAECFH